MRRRKSIYPLKPIDNMKRISSLLALALVTALTLVACKNDTKQMAGIPDDLVDSTLTPDEHKENIEEIAVNFINYFDPADTEDLLVSIATLSEYIPYDESEYYMVAKELGLGVKNFSAYHFTMFATRASEQIVIDLTDPDAPLGGFCLTFDGEEWVESEIDPDMIQIVWDNAVATFSWNGSEKWQHEFKEEDLLVSVKVPSTINFSLKLDDVEHLGMTIKTKLSDKYTIACDSEVRIYGGYVLAAGSDADKKGCSTSSSISKDGKKIFGTYAAVAINDFTNLDNWYTEYYNEWNEEYYKELDPSEYFAENIKNGTARVDVLNLSVIGAGDFKGMVETLDRYDETTESEKEFYDKVCKLLNEKVDLILIYNCSNEKIAEVVFQTTLYGDEYWGEYYGLEPILLFPDGSKYAFEDFFNEQAFGDLFNAIYELMNKLPIVVE